MAPNRLQRNITTLDVLSKAPKKQRQALINTATRDQIFCICDCANNILIENIPLTAQELKKLKRYQDLIRYLADTKGQRKKIKQKKQYLIQSGGFLPILLAPILTAATSILTETLLNKK